MMANYKDFGNEFIAHPDTDDLLTRTGELAVRQAVRNLFFAEKPFHPEIGINMNKLLFENINPITTIAINRKIVETLQLFEPRINVINVNINDDIDAGGLGITIIFSVKGYNKTQTINIFLERLR